MKMITLDHEPEPAYTRPYRELRLENKPISLLLLEATSKLRSILCNALNYEQVLPNEKNNLFRDYRGLAVILKAPTTEQRNIGRSTDPTLNILYYLNSLSSSKVLNQSINNNLISGNNQIAHQQSGNHRLVNQFCTMELLMHALEKLGRYDVIDDLLDELKRNPIDESINYDAIANKVIPKVDLPDLNTKYDAYISYADNDLAFVQDLCNWLESPPVNLKLYLRARDLPIGTMEYAYFTELMENQCNRLIMILSDEFLSSAECEFQTKFTLSLQIEERQRKLIPIIHKPCKLPGFINFLSKIDLSRAQSPQIREWTMGKLVKSLNSNVASESSRVPFQPRMSITNAPPSLSIHTVNSSNISDHRSSSNHSSSEKMNSISNQKFPKIKLTLAEGENLNDSTSKLNSINSNDKSSNYSNSSPLNTTRSITQTFSTDTDALIEKQKNFKLFSKVWKHLKFFKHNN